LSVLEGPLVDAEHEGEPVIDGSLLVVAQIPDVLAKVASLDRAEHLAEHLRPFAAELDFGMKARSRRRRRGRADNDGRGCQQSVGPDDDRVPTALLDSTSTSPHRDRVDVSADHAGRMGRNLRVRAAQ
jgi:hypothetical protein